MCGGGCGNVARLVRDAHAAAGVVDVVRGYMRKLLAIDGGGIKGIVPYQERSWLKMSI
jgi:hypothetical protein